MNLRQLIDDGKQELPFQYSSFQQNELIRGLKKIIDLPAEERDRWLFRVKGDTTSEPDNGLSERGVNDGKDHKFFFHYRNCLIEQLIGAGINIEPHQEFFKSAQRLYNSLASYAEDVLINLDKQLPGYDFHERLIAREVQLRHVLRLLYYEPNHENMARIHDDRDGITFAVAESRPGLLFENENILYTPAENKILVFNGLKAELHTDGKLKSMRHYVKNLVLHEPRWAIVFFTHYHIDALTDREVEELTAKRIGTYITA